MTLCLRWRHGLPTSAAKHILGVVWKANGGVVPSVVGIASANCNAQFCLCLIGPFPFLCHGLPDQFRCRGAGQGGASVPLFYRITQKGKASPCTGVTFATPDVVSFIRPFPEPCLGWPPAERTRQQFRCCGHGLAFLCLRAAFTLARFLGSGDLGWCGQ